MRRFQSFGTIFHVRGGPRAPPALFALGTWTLFLVPLNLAVFGFLLRSLVFSTSQTSIARVYGRELFRIWKQPDTLTSRSSMVSFVVAFFHEHVLAQLDFLRYWKVNEACKTVWLMGRPASECQLLIFKGIFLERHKVQFLHLQGIVRRMICCQAART